jgi:hypothetical protein
MRTPRVPSGSLRRAVSSRPLCLPDRVLCGGAEGGCAVYHSEQLPGSCPLYDLALDPLESMVAAVGADGAVRFWDVASGRPVGALAPERGAGAHAGGSSTPGAGTGVGRVDGAVRVRPQSGGRRHVR